MLQQVLENIHNYFISSRMTGTFDTASLSLPYLEGQRFLITGSVLNDGVYTYHAAGIKDDNDGRAVGLQDETFTGTICGLAVPPAVKTLSEEIKAWVADNGGIVNSPYQSESVIGAYSYTKASGGSGAGGAVTWQDVFKDRLNRWRKVSF